MGAAIPSDSSELCLDGSKFDHHIEVLSCKEDDAFDDLSALPLTLEQIVQGQGFSEIRVDSECELCGRHLPRGERAYRSQNTKRSTRCGRCHMTRHNTWRIDKAMASARRMAILSVLESAPADSEQLESWFGYLYTQDMRELQQREPIDVSRGTRQGRELKVFALLEAWPGRSEGDVIDKDVDALVNEMRRLTAATLVRKIIEENGNRTAETSMFSSDAPPISADFEVNVGDAWMGVHIFCEENLPSQMDYSSLPVGREAYLMHVSKFGIKCAKLSECREGHVFSEYSYDLLGDRSELVPRREMTMMVMAHIGAIVFGQWQPELSMVAQNEDLRRCRRGIGIGGKLENRRYEGAEHSQGGMR